MMKYFIYMSELINYIAPRKLGRKHGGGGIIFVDGEEVRLSMCFACLHDLDSLGLWSLKIHFFPF